MAESKDWLPRSRAGQLAMALTWSEVLDDNGDAWSVPASQVSAFDALMVAAQSALAKTQNTATRTHADSVACETAFKALVEKMRFLKNNYFNSPPRTADDLALLELSPKNPPTPVPKPENQVTGKTRPLGDHLVELVLEIVGDMVKDTKASDYGFRVYVAIEDPAAAPGAKGKFGPYLAAAPQSGEDFSFSFFIKHKREILDFDATDRMKKVWFCIHLEQEKGGQDGKGPWGPLIWTAVP
jgi:hypothetical protein